MKDVYFTFTTAAIAAVAVLSYGLRMLLRGTARFERTTQVGGSALLGQEIMDMGQWAVRPVAAACAALGITPNGLTWASAIFGLGAGVALADGRFGLATLLAVFSTVGDILDGQVARLTKTGSDTGELLDAAVDRYTEFFFVGGLVVYYRASLVNLAIALAALLACFMVSYSTAKAEALQIPPPRGPMRRHERAVYFIVGSGLTSFFGATIVARWPALPPTLPQISALAVVALAGNYSALLRLHKTGVALREKGRGRAAG